MCLSTLSPHLCPPPTPDFVHSPRAACVLGPIGRPLGPLGSDPCPLRPRRSCLMPCHSRSGMVAPPHPAGLGRSSPSKTPPDRDWLARGRRSPPQPQNTFLGPRTTWAPLRASLGMCPSPLFGPPGPTPGPEFACRMRPCSVSMCRYVQVCACIYRYAHVCVCMYMCV